MLSGDSFSETAGYGPPSDSTLTIETLLATSTLLPPQHKPEIIERARPTPQRNHSQIPKLLPVLPDLQQRLDEMRLPKRDVQEDPVGLESAMDLP